MSGTYELWRLDRRTDGSPGSYRWMVWHVAGPFSSQAHEWFATRMEAEARLDELLAVAVPSREEEKT